ncbi:monovalent cation/H+ antiporter complex subunit F [Actinoplanes philippinensis]|uniref:monovalent cation/H+ antiporter complex subunit F n=1 Tax=Actinoplanes philippinensis TaxID=35752 RepID=UPI003400981B
MIVVAAIAAVFLAAAAGMALVRIIRGPSTLDRIVGTDVLLAITVCAIATEAAYSRDATGLPILLGLSLLGAAGSVAVARFADPVARPSPAISPALPGSGGVRVSVDSVDVLSGAEGNSPSPGSDHPESSDPTGYQESTGQERGPITSRRSRGARE